MSLNPTTTKESNINTLQVHSNEIPVQNQWINVQHAWVVVITKIDHEILDSKGWTYGPYDVGAHVLLPIDTAWLLVYNGYCRIEPKRVHGEKVFMQGIKKRR